MLKRFCFILFLLLFLFSVFIYWSKRKPTTPKIVIVPHHNIVQKQREDFFRMVGQQRSKTTSVILLAPDHFSPNQRSISYSDQDWKLVDQKLLFDKNLAQKIIRDEYLNNLLLSKDHGITNLLLEIKQTFPEAKILPFILGQKVGFNDLQKLIDDLSLNCSDSCLIVGSVDFSHYLPNALADVHDNFSAMVLENQNQELVSQMEIDSQQTIFVLLAVAKNMGDLSWNEKWHSNSGALEKNRDAETTSHFMGYFSESDVDNFNSKKFSFVLARNIDDKMSFKSLGERFFYGSTYQNLQLNHDFFFKDKFVITNCPQENSQITFDDDKQRIIICLKNDFILAGRADGEELQLVFLPIKKEKDQTFFKVGKDKTVALKNLFTDWQQQPNIKVDSDSGLIDL